MIFGFFKKLIKYYVDKLIDWLRMKRLDLQLNNEIKKYHQQLDKTSFIIRVLNCSDVTYLYPK